MPPVAFFEVVMTDQLPIAFGGLPASSVRVLELDLDMPSRDRGGKFGEAGVSTSRGQRPQRMNLLCL